jgi:putative addiction module component (TIGR02574 family)
MKPAFSEAIMSTEALDQLRSQISRLSESEKAELARELLMSLDGPRDESVEQAWNDEIVRRVSQVQDGKATLLSRDQVLNQLHERLDRQR